MTEFILNRKSLMTFGKWSLILFSLVLIGVFITQYIIPILALGSPTLVNNVNVTLNSPANNGYSTSANTNFTFTAGWDSTFNLTNCTLWGNFTGTFTANATNATTIVNNVINGINTSVADGAYLWNVYCYNATSHGNYSTSNYTVTVDLTNPVLRNPYPSNNSYINNANVVFNVSFTEQNINYTVNATLYYRKSSQTDWQTQTLQCWNSAPSFACNYSAINLGTAPIWLLDTNVLQFFYNTTDSAGRTGQNGTASAPLLLTLDTTQPTSVTGLAHSDDAPTGYDNDTTLVFNWTAATDANGILNYKIYVSENSGAYVYNGTNNTPLGYSFTGVNGNTYRVNVTTVDNANNENTTGTVSSTITVDTTQPSSAGAVYFKPDPTDSYDDDTILVVNWTAATDANGILNYKIYVSENSGAYVYNGTNNTPLGYSFTGSDGKNYSINVTAVDNAGIENTTGTTSNTTIYIDTTDPASPTNVAFQADPTTSFDNDVTLVVNWTAATDVTSGVKQYKIYVSENSGAYVYNGTNNTPLGYSFTGVNGNTYRVNVTTVDNVIRENTTGTLSSTTITVDTIQPSSPTNVAFQADPTTSFDNDVTLVVNWTAATDANGILNYKIYVSENSGAYVYNGTNNTPLGYSFTGVNGNTYRVNVTANDTAYNENTTGTVSSTTITIDTTSPTTILTVSPTLANNSYTSNNFVYVNVTFTETNPDTCLLQFNNGTASNYTMTRPGSGTNCYINMTSQLDGAWNYSVFVNDSANNWGRNGTYYVTVDTVNPIINETVPVNGGYFNNPSSMTFQVKLTEQNRNNSINVTVYWKLQGAGSYTSNTLNCYGSAPTWVCNITGISTGLTNGQVLQFLFNTTDSAGRTAANGIGASPLNATADTGAPTYTNNNANTTVAGKYDTVLIYAYWTDADTLNTAVLETNETGAAANKTTGCPNYPCTLSGSTSWSNFTWSNSSVAVGTVIAWKIYANDSVGNQNVTSQGTFSTDNTKPTYTNNGTSVSSGSTIGKGTSILLYAQWTDNVRLHGWVVEYNASGTSLANTTFNTTFGTGNWTNYTITTSASAGTTIHARIYVNDTSGNENYTAPTWTWTIDSTAPTYTNNSTNVTSGETIVKGTPIYVSALWADVIQLNKGWMEENITGTTNTSILSDNWTNYTFSTSGLIAGRVYVVRLFANDTSGNENYTAPTWTWTIDGTAPTYANKSDSVSGEAIYSPRKSYILNISWTDNLGNGNVSTVLFNFSSLSTNQTATSLGSSNYSVTLTDLGFGNYTYRWYANDTSGNWNSTIVYTLNITQNTTNPINFYFVNSTPTTVTNGNMTISAGNIVTVNGTSIYPNAGTVTLYSNITTGSTALAQITNPNTTLSSLVGGVYVFIANTTGTVNYTSNSTGPGTFYLTVTSDTTGPTVLLYDSTSGTYSFDNSSSKKSTATVNLKVYVSDGGMTTNEPCFVKIGSVTPINFANYSGSSTAGWCNGTFTVSSATEGMNLMNITVNDTADNPGSNATYYLTVDNTPPVVTLTATPTSGTYNKLSGNRYWVNGTVYDLISMGSSNVTTNNSAFTAYSFNGTNNTAFSIANSTAVSDGYFAITFYYNDSATNTGSASIAFYIDNTPPSSVIGLKNSSTGTYQPSSTQVIEVLVTDVLKTNDTITLYYMTNINQTWLTKTMTGTPGTSTTYSTTIDTSKLSNDMYVIYYITGSDNATNSITNGGSASSPLANITIDQYCGNNGTALTYCKHSGAITWFELWLPQGSIMNTWSSLSGNRTAPKVLESISGTYSYLYYYNTTSWISYDPSVPWSQSDLKYMNNTNNYPYWINMTSTGTIRIS